MVNLKNIIKNYKVFIDTCSLLHPQAENIFYKTFPPILVQNDIKLILPHRVVNEIEKLRKHKSQSTRNYAIKAFKILGEYSQKSLIDIRGEPEDPFADNVFHYVFSKFRTKHNLCLLTQDVKLSKNIAAIGDMESVKSSYEIMVLKITNHGEMIEWDHSKKPDRVSENKFEKANRVVNRKPSIISVNEIPGLNDVV